MYPQDPKTSRWLWDIRERSRQKRRTEHYREIMKMQQTQADPLALTSEEDDSAETKDKLEMLRRLSEPEQMENYLSYGKWDLKEGDIERLQKDDEMRQRVSITIPFINQTIYRLKHRYTSKEYKVRTFTSQKWTYNTKVNDFIYRRIYYYLPA